MATRWDTFPIKFEGGLTTNLGRIEQGIQTPGSATTLQNFEADVEGGYTRILGYQKFSNTAVGGTGQVFGVVLLSSSEVLAVRGGQHQYSTGTIWTNKLALANPVITTIDSSSFNFNGTKKTVVVDGINYPAFFNHTTKLMTYAVTPHADALGAKYVEVFKNHVFYASGSKLVFSSPFLEEDFVPANGAGIVNIGDTITGLIVFREQLVVFCGNAIHRISGSSLLDFKLQPIALNTGCINGKTVQEVGGDIMYLGPDGVRYLSATERVGDFGLTRASAKVQPLITNTLSSNTRYCSITIAEKNQYRLFSYFSSVPKENTEGFIGVKFSDQTSEQISWSTTKGIKAYDASKFQNEAGEFFVFCSDTDFVYRLESGNAFDGGDIEAIFETPYIPITDPKKRKTVYKHTLYTKSGGIMEVMCSLKFDYGQPGSSFPSSFLISSGTGASVYGGVGTTYGVSPYGAAGQEEFYNNVVGSGFVVAVRYSSKSQSAVYNLNFAVLEFKENERR